MKKVFAIVLVVALMLSCAACDKKKSAGSDVPTITWYVHGDKQDDVASVVDAVNKIAVEKIGAKLDLKFIDQASYSEKMNMMMASGTPFDLCFTGYINTYKTAAQKGAFLALDDYLKDTPELKEAIADYTWDTVRNNGKIYAVPNLQILAYQINFYTFKDLAQKYGLLSELNNNERITLEQMENYLQEIKDNEPSYYPIRFNYYTTHFITSGSPLTSYKEKVSGTQVTFDKNGKLKEISAELYDENTLWAFEKARDWYKKGFIRSDIVSMSDDTAEHNANKYASWIEKYKPGILEEMQQKRGREVVCFQMSEPIYPSTAPDAMTAVSKTSKNPEKAVKMLELVNTNKEVYNLICYGIEGKHYNLDKDGRVVYVENSGYAPKASWKFGNQFNALLLPGQPDDVWEQTKALNEKATRSPLIGFTVDESSITTELSALNTVSSEFSAIWKGAADPKPMFKEYTKKAKEAGLDKVVKEVKKQYKTWEKTQK